MWGGFPQVSWALGGRVGDYPAQNDFVLEIRGLHPETQAFTSPSGGGINAPMATDAGRDGLGYGETGPSMSRGGQRNVPQTIGA